MFIINQDSTEENSRLCDSSQEVKSLQLRTDSKSLTQLINIILLVIWACKTIRLVFIFHSRICYFKNFK